MNKKTELEYAINALFTFGTSKQADIQEAKDRLDYAALLQSIKYNAETVYAYTTDGGFLSGCNYCGLELFPQEATLIHTYCVMEDAGVVQMGRFLELWLLEDFSFALVSSTETDYEDGKFTSAYRVLRATDLDEIAQEMELDLDVIILKLTELAEAYYALGQITYEL